jgi:chaperone modulatory protein CbpM
MSEADGSFIQAPVVEEEIHLTMVELCHACSATEEQVTVWVLEGVLEPSGDRPQDWSFTGQSLRRARLALRLSRDLELNPAGVALALDLLDEIATLKARLQRTGAR